MIDSIYYAYATALFLLCFGYVLGYVVGRVDFIYRTVHLLAGHVAGIVETKQPDFFTKTAAEDRREGARAKIAIDASKFVSATKTDSLVKSSETTLGKTTQTDDDIQASVSRLAQLKGK
jgi:hypothetical protein